MIAPFRRLFLQVGTEPPAVGAATARAPLQESTNAAHHGHQRQRQPPVGEGCVKEPKTRTAAGGAPEDRLALASAAYEVAYISGDTRFAWDLALPELNLLKARRRQRQGVCAEEEKPEEKKAGAA